MLANRFQSLSEGVRMLEITWDGTAHSAQRTAHSAQRTAHSAQHTAHSAQRGQAGVSGRTREAGEVGAGCRWIDTSGAPTFRSRHG